VNKNQKAYLNKYLSERLSQQRRLQLESHIARIDRDLGKKDAGVIYHEEWESIKEYISKLKEECDPHNPNC
jgi:hypothetical protein